MLIASDLMEHIGRFFSYLSQMLSEVDTGVIEQMARRLDILRQERGRLFLVGVGGSAANCSHAVNDFRKLCYIEAYTPVDNISEITARTNDEGWTTTFQAWLEVSHFSNRDVLFVFSVGGGDQEKGISSNLVAAVQYAKEIGADVMGIVGPNGGYTQREGSIVFSVPVQESKWITPISEAMQGVVWHALVSHPLLQQRTAKWESQAMTMVTR